MTNWFYRARAVISLSLSFFPIAFQQCPPQLRYCDIAIAEAVTLHESCKPQTSKNHHGIDQWQGYSKRFMRSAQGVKARKSKRGVAAIFCCKTFGPNYGRYVKCETLWQKHATTIDNRHVALTSLKEYVATSVLVGWRRISLYGAAAALSSGAACELPRLLPWESP